LLYLGSGVAADGHVFVDCKKTFGHILYHTAVVSAAFAMAGRLGFAGFAVRRDHTLAYVLSRQQGDGSFVFSRGDYGVLSDQRSYPRVLSMMLFHFMVTVQAAIP
jgi:hypothetical protein